MKTPALTVIIPVYNTEQYLRTCLDSVLAQTLQDMEILCIDDGSTDGSSDILEDYAKKDKRIRMIRKENGGLVSVRKLGVKEAKGGYVGFVDSDDWIEPEMYDSLLREAVMHCADMVSCNHMLEGSYTSVSADTVPPGLYDKGRMEDLRDCAILNLQKRDKGLGASLCTKIFRTSLMRRVIPRIPNEITLSEDKVTTVTFLLECESAVVTDGAYYHYRLHTGSMYHVEDADYLLKYQRVHTYFKKLYSHKNFTDRMRRQAELYIVQFLIKGINTQMGFSFRNLLWIDPAWMADERLGERVALCGKGELADTYEKQLRANKSKVFAGYVSNDDTRDYDSVVIAVKDRHIADEMRSRLVEKGIPAEKILWFKQEEIFWKYAEAMGLLDDRSPAGDAAMR